MTRVIQPPAQLHTTRHAIHVDDWGNGWIGWLGGLEDCDCDCWTGSQVDSESTDYMMYYMVHDVDRPETG